MPTHEQYMQQAIELAQRASGLTSPNPLVGAVIVRNDKIVGEGWHHKAGLPHAEVEAINNANGKTDNATIYVSLEPCSHHGKTPPCTEAIIKAGIKKVVYATKDINKEAEGGSRLLRNAGIEVIENICEQAALYTNRFFFHAIKTKQPFVIAKFASSLDGKTATHSGNSQWITGTAARNKGHEARQACDAIIIGAQTAIADNPTLSVRNPDAFKHSEPSHPLRVILDSTGRVPLNNPVLNTSNGQKTLVVTTDLMSPEHEHNLNAQNVEVLRLPFAKNSQRPDLPALMQALGKRSIQSVLVEGGQTVLGAFLDAQLINEVWAFIAPKIIGGTNAAPSIGGTGIDQLKNAPALKDVQVEHLNNDLLIRGLVCSPA